MLRNVELPFFPSATDCLAWSEDGELAVVAGEHVHILVSLPPRTRPSSGILSRAFRYQTAEKSVILSADAVMNHGHMSGSVRTSSR